MLLILLNFRNNANIADGFKTNFVVKASLFDPEKVQVWPVINTLFESVPALRVLRPLIEKVMPIVAGKSNMNEVETMLVRILFFLWCSFLLFFLLFCLLLLFSFNINNKHIDFCFPSSLFFLFFQPGQCCS